MLKRCLVFFLLLSTLPVWGANVDDGLKRFQEGEFEQARDIWLPLAEQGDARAAYYMSLLYAQGKSVARNKTIAMEFLATAARNGHAVAQFNLGNHYNQGKWVEEKPELAAYWWRVAAGQDMARAQHNLATLYLMGRGVPQDIGRARHWYSRAAENGSETSAILLQQIESDPVAKERLRVNETVVEPGPVEAPAALADSSVTDQPDTKEVSDTPDTETSGEAGVVNVVSDAQGSSPEPVPAITTTVSEPEPDRQPEPAPKSEPQPEPKPLPAKALVDTQSSPIKELADIDPRQQAETESFNALGHDWINQQPSQHFILQILASESARAVRRVLQQNKFDRQVAVYRFLSRGKVFYAIGYGRFLTVEEARAAASELPAGLRNNTPWPRRYAVIQALIR